MLADIIIQLGEYSYYFIARIGIYMACVSAAVTLFDLLSFEFTIRFALGRPARKGIAQTKPCYVGWEQLARGVPLILLGLAIASVFILVWSIYRTTELTDGWQAHSNTMRGNI